MDEVDCMLDTYGYRTGGRVGYEGGNLVDMEDVILASTKGKKSEEEIINRIEIFIKKLNIFDLLDEEDDSKENPDASDTSFRTS